MLTDSEFTIQRMPVTAKCDACGGEFGGARCGLRIHSKKKLTPRENVSGFSRVLSILACVCSAECAEKLGPEWDVWTKEARFAIRNSAGGFATLLSESGWTRPGGGAHASCRLTQEQAKTLLEAMKMHGNLDAEIVELGGDDV